MLRRLGTEGVNSSRSLPLVLPVRSRMAPLVTLCEGPDLIGVTKSDGNKPLVLPLVMFCPIHHPSPKSCSIPTRSPDSILSSSSYVGMKVYAVTWDVGGGRGGGGRILLPSSSRAKGARLLRGLLKLISGSLSLSRWSLGRLKPTLLDASASGWSSCGFLFSRKPL